MQVITHWPRFEELKLPTGIKEAFKAHLLAPFDSEAQAKAFWRECPSTLLIFDTGDSLCALPEEIRSQALFCRDNAEFVETLPEGYQLALAIVSDDGAGIYLLWPSTYSFDKGD